MAKRAVCAANMRGIGMGMHIYSNDNKEWFPHHTYETNYVQDVTLSWPEKADDDDDDAGPREHGVRWVGTMGSNEFLKISEHEKTSPKRSHPSRSLFLLIIQGMTVPKQFTCPSSRDSEDDLRNYGPDAGGSAVGIASRPGRDRFDFRGYDHLSYGYQLPYGPRARPSQILDVRVAVAADKGPYYQSGGPGLAGSNTTRDERSSVHPPAAWAGRDGPISNEEWRPYNSRNHRGEGQNVLYMDMHVSFVKGPLAGLNGDNICTIQSKKGDRVATLIGLVPNAEQAWGPMTNTDSFIVP
ncbi:MAG: hypothetical protein IID33_07075 [Planctomycetes bacterium]|nr:hypothetical protein [Planctomycetota bacterium]